MKLIKKSKKLYFFECDSMNELHTIISRQITSEIKEKGHTSLLLSPSHELKEIYEYIISDYKKRIVKCSITRRIKGKSLTILFYSPLSKY